MELQVPPCPVHHLLLRLLQVPLGKFLGGEEPVRGADVDLGEEQRDAVRYVEPSLVVDVVLGINEALPLRLGLRGRGANDGREMGPLPLAVVAAELDIGDDGVEGDAAVASGRGAAGWAELEAAVGYVGAARAEGEEEEDQ